MGTNRNFIAWICLSLTCVWVSFHPLVTWLLLGRFVSPSVHCNRLSGVYLWHLEPSSKTNFHLVFKYKSMLKYVVGCLENNEYGRNTESTWMLTVIQWCHNVWVWLMGMHDMQADEKLDILFSFVCVCSLFWLWHVDCCFTSLTDVLCLFKSCLPVLLLIFTLKTATV